MKEGEEIGNWFGLQGSEEFISPGLIAVMLLQPWKIVVFAQSFVFGGFILYEQYFTRSGRRSREVLYGLESAAMNLSRFTCSSSK